VVTPAALALGAAVEAALRERNPGRLLGRTTIDREVAA
jgi:hypothetical protein